MRAIVSISHGLARPITPLEPTRPVSALMAMSETPNSTPAAAPSITPWCSTGPPSRGPMTSSAPSTTRAPSNAIIPASENCEWAPPWPGRVIVSMINPAAVSATPAHWRRPTVSPKTRSAMTARRTTPPDRTACTTDIGARARAATCSTQAPSATSIPIANQREANSASRRGERPADVDRGRSAGSPVLVEEAEVRRDRAEQCQQDADVKRHGEENGRAGRGARLSSARPTPTPLCSVSTTNTCSTTVATTGLARRVTFVTRNPLEIVMIAR